MENANGVELIEHLKSILGKMRTIKEVKKGNPTFGKPPFSLLLLSDEDYFVFEKRDSKLNKTKTLFFVSKAEISSFLRRIDERQKEIIGFEEKLKKRFGKKDSDCVDNFDLQCHIRNFYSNNSIRFYKFDLVYLKDDDRALFVHSDYLFIKEPTNKRGLKKQKGVIFEDCGIVSAKWAFKEPLRLYYKNKYDRNFFGVNSSGVMCGVRSSVGNKIVLNRNPTYFNIFKALELMVSEDICENLKACIRFFSPKDHYLEKDILRESVSLGYVPFDAKTLYERGIRSTQDYCEFIFGKVPYNLNKLSFGIAVSFCFCLSYIEPRDYTTLYLFAKDLSLEIANGKRSSQEVGETTSNRNGFRNPITKKTRKTRSYIDLICLFFKERVLSNENSSFMNTKLGVLEDTINLAHLLGETISLRITSYNGINRLHNSFVQKHRERKVQSVSDRQIKIAKKYKSLKVSGFDLIQKERELFIEGVEQNHCVYSYLDKIESGRCLIYTGNVDNKKWTVELNIKNGSFDVVQIRSRFNSTPDSETERKIVSAFNSAKKQLVSLPSQEC